MKREDIDFGDSDAGDYDPTEVVPHVVDVWHPSFKAVEPAQEVRRGGLRYLAERENGLRCLSALRAQHASEKSSVESRKPVFLSCWKDTPEIFRRMITFAAGLPKETVEKCDRDLTENEKAFIRTAMSDMRLELSRLVAL